jgi:hypothetical protein
MYFSLMTQEMLASAIQLVCVISTALAAVASYLMTLRF